jgi:type I restriction enzyme M protein
MEGLKAQLLEQFEKGEELREKIKANFDVIL